MSFVPFTDNSLNVDPGLFFPETMIGTRSYEQFPIYGEEKDAGSVGAPMFPTNGIEFLVYSIGTDVVTAPVSPATLYTHTISQATHLASLTVEKNLGGAQSLQFAGTRVGKYSIKAAASDTEAEFTADLTAQSWAILDTPTTLSFVDEEPFIFAEYTLSWHTKVLAQATNFTLDITNGIKPIWTINGSHELQFLPSTHLKVTGTFTVVWDLLNGTATDDTRGYFSQMLAQQDAALSFKLTHPSTGGSIELLMPHVRLAKDTIDPKMSDVVSEKIKFSAYQKLGTTSMISAVILNQRATAY